MNQKMKMPAFLLAAVLLLSLPLSQVWAGGQGQSGAQGQTAVDHPPSANRSKIPAAFSDLDPVFPLAQKATFKVMRTNFTDVHPASTDLWMWQRYEELTNVHIDWEDVPSANWTERRNLVMASNDLPEAFYIGNFSMSDIATYGTGGSFIKLNDLIEKNNPHLKVAMAKWPVLKQAITQPDGNIYSLPYLQPDPYDASLRYYINKKWLDRLGLAVPKTVDELTNVLRQFKQKDANGNGNPNDEFPWSHVSTYGNWTLESQLYGSFGGGNKGNQAIGMGIDLGPDGKVRFIPTSEPLKKVWQLLAGWYKEGIIDDGYFSSIDYAQWVAYGEQDRVGLQAWVQPYFIGAQAGANFVGINVLTGPSGDKILSWCEPPVRGASSFEITNRCKDPALLMKWVDFFYSDQGTIFGFLGEEGVTYHKEGNTLVYNDNILNSKEGAQVGAFQYVDNVYGGYYPYIDMDVPRYLAAKRMTMQNQFGTTEDINQYIPKDGYWATFNGTADEAEELSTLWTDLSAYRDEMRPKFVTGQLNFASDWDAYVAQMKRMGSDRYTQIRQTQYDRIR
jgi:putative aldouronate transport system substrate-binding protein